MKARGARWPSLSGAALALSLLTLSLPGLTPSAQAAPAPDPDKVEVQRVTLGSWNLEHFGPGGAERRFGEARNIKRRPDVMARYILAAGVDALALQEVYPDAPAADDPPGQRRARTLDAVVHVLQKTTGVPWESVVLPNQNAAESGLHNAVIWRADRLKLKKVVALDIPRTPDGGSPWHRPPAVVLLTGRGAERTDFGFVSVHQKSGRDHADMRAEEARRLGAALTAFSAAHKEQDLVVLGDFNCELGHTAPLAVAYKAAGLIDLNYGDQRTVLHRDPVTRGWREAPLDRVFISAQPEFVRDFKVVAPTEMDPKLSEREFRKAYSDHLLVKTSIQIWVDDDPS